VTGWGQRRLTILLVEQRVVLEGPREALLADARVQHTYLGA
jgi:hypothetical protein